MLNLQIDSASGCWIKKRCSQDCCKNFFGQVIESDARAFQTSLKCRLFDPSWQHSIRESRTHILMCFDPYEIENVKQKNSSKCSYLICCRGQVQRPFPSDSLAVRRILVLLMTSNEHRQLGQCIVSDRTAQQQPFLQNVRHLSTLWHLTQRFSCWSVLLRWQYTKRFLSLHVAANVARVLSRAASRNANHRNGHFTSG